MNYTKWIEKMWLALIWEYNTGYQIWTQEDYNKSEYIKFVKELDISDKEKMDYYKSMN